MKKNILFSAMLVIVLVLGMTVIGCDLTIKEIDPKFRGKWECQSIEYSGTTYTLPCEFNGVQIDSGGYEISATSIKQYVNGAVVANAKGLYTKGNSFYYAYGSYGISIELNGDNATLTTIMMEEDYCVKVSNFSWE
jgi:hypothetical protein